MRIPAHKNTVNPPGQIVNPIDRSKTIGGIIDRVRRDDPIETVMSKETSEQIRQRAYAAGFIDGKKEGFAEGIAWVKGK